MELIDKRSQVQTQIKADAASHGRSAKGGDEIKMKHSEAQDMEALEVMENGDSVNKAQNYTVVQTRQQIRKYSQLINR